jgi:Spy/CpxP family protein refolding chaperone
MKQTVLSTLLTVLLALNASWVIAQTNLSPASSIPAAAQETKTVDKHFKPIQKALDLNDAAKEAKVREIFAAHLKAFDAWHAQNDSHIKELWNQFNDARKKQNEADADAALAKIDGVYATFKPEHDKFLSELSSVLTPEQVDKVKDALTVNKVEVTYHAYGEIFHGLTDEQKAFILKNLKAAREEAIDANAMSEKSAFFKKYKIKIEAYLTSQGYDVKQSYRDFVAKQKAEKDAKKASASAKPDAEQ